MDCIINFFFLSLGPLSCVVVVILKLFLGPNRLQSNQVLAVAIDVLKDSCNTFGRDF